MISSYQENKIRLSIIVKAYYSKLIANYIKWLKSSNFII
jgi:hypothetical protein